jgi:hypothetical protein
MTQVWKAGGHEVRLRSEEEELDMLTALGLLAGWVALQYWVLPKLGVPT